MGSNMQCALCIIPCGKSSSPLRCLNDCVVRARPQVSVPTGNMLSARGYCLATYNGSNVHPRMTCVQPTQMSCTELELDVISPILSAPSLLERAPLIAAMNRVSAECTTCILATFNTVCGSCVRDSLHVFVDYDIPVIPCLPDLATRLMLGQARSLSSSMTSRAAFGVSSPILSDLFSPTSETVHGYPVYHGAHTGFRAYVCDPDDAVQRMAISTSDSRDDWALCDALVRIDLGTGAVTQQTEGVDPTPLRATFHTGGWDSCPPYTAPTAEVIFFPVGSTADHIECFLAYNFGPQQSAEKCTARKMEVHMPANGLPVVRLRSDIVICSESVVLLVGHSTVVEVGRHQIRVSKGAALSLVGLAIVASVESSALWVDGSASLMRVTFRNCSAQGLLVWSEFRSLIDGDGAYTVAHGAAVYIGERAEASLIECQIADCRVSTARGDVSGGALVVGKQSSMFVADSVFSNNTASADIGLFALGGTPCVGIMPSFRLPVAKALHFSPSMQIVYRCYAYERFQPRDDSELADHRQCCSRREIERGGRRNCSLDEGISRGG
jgi:hypothetical protein